MGGSCGFLQRGSSWTLSSSKFFLSHVFSFAPPSVWEHRVSCSELCAAFSLTWRWCRLRKIGAGRISRGRLRSEDDDRGARYAPLWDVAKAEAAVTLCRLRDMPPMAQRTGTASDTAVTAASADGIVCHYPLRP